MHRRRKTSNLPPPPAHTWLPQLLHAGVTRLAWKICVARRPRGAGAARDTLCASTHMTCSVKSPMSSRKLQLPHTYASLTRQPAARSATAGLTRAICLEG